MCGRSTGPGSHSRSRRPGPARVELGDRLVDGLGLDLDVARQVLEERRQGGGEMHLGHGYATTATSTEEIAGR